MSTEYAMKRIEDIRERMLDEPGELFVSGDIDLEPDNTALLIIDMQKYECCQDIAAGKKERENRPKVAEYWFSRLSGLVVPNIQRLANFFRENHLKVIYLCVGPLLPDGSDMHALRRSWWEKRLKAIGSEHFFGSGTLEYEVLDELRPQEGDLVINKNSISAFTSTNLDQLLKNMNVVGLVFSGMTTNFCVETTARDAADRGYRCVLVDDACAAKSQVEHDMTMVNFVTLFGTVMLTGEIIQYLGSRMG